MNTLPVKSNPNKVHTDQQETGNKLPDFLLTAVQPCEVKLVSDLSKQTQSSKTKAELLADGQCEV